MSELTQAQFGAIYADTVARVFAYSRRHCGSELAEDVVAEVYLTAWRRRAELPHDPLPWLLVTARNCARNAIRGRMRRTAVADLLDSAARREPPAESTASAAIDRVQMLRCLARLSEPDREALLLTAWDGLSGADAARVAGCSPKAFSARLQRARTRLAALLDGPAPSVTPKLFLLEGGTK